MPKLFWTYTGRMAFSILCSVAGALLVSQLGLLQPKPAPKLEKIVFDQSDLTEYDNIGQRVETAHIAMRELKAKQEAEARRQAAAELAEKEAAAEAARAKQAAAAQQAAQPERKKETRTARREPAAATPPTAAPAAPLVITPTVVAERPAPSREGLEGVIDKLTSGVSRIRDFVVNAVRIEKPANLPFGGTSASSESMSGIADLHGRLRLPAFDM